MKKIIRTDQLIGWKRNINAGIIPFVDALPIFATRIAYMHDFGFYDNIDGPAIIDIFDNNKISNKNYACEAGFYDNKLSWQNKIKNL